MGSGPWEGRAGGRGREEGVDPARSGLGSQPSAAGPLGSPLPREQWGAVAEVDRGETRLADGARPALGGGGKKAQGQR